MRKVVFVFILCAFFAAPAMADYYGGRMNVTRVVDHYQGAGGEFTLYQDGIPQYLSNEAYAGVARAQDGRAESFQTFCVELGEMVLQPMDLTVSTTDIDEVTGVVTGAGSHAILGGKVHGDNLDDRTAYLYAKFATGALSNYIWSGTGRAASAATLQKTIWYLEEETYLSSGAGGFTLTAGQLAQAQAWIDEAESAITAGKWSGIGDVRILNTYDTSGQILAQDQLYFVPVPGALLLGILGLSAAGIKLRKHA